MNLTDTQRAVLGFIFLFTGVVAAGFILNKLATMIAVWGIQIGGTGFLAFSVKLTSLTLLAIPTWFGWRAYAKRKTDLTFEELFARAKKVDS